MLHPLTDVYATNEGHRLGRDTIGNILVHHYVPYTNFDLTSFNETYGHFQVCGLILEANNNCVYNTYTDGDLPVCRRPNGGRRPHSQSSRQGS